MPFAAERKVGASWFLGNDKMNPKIVILSLFTMLGGCCWGKEPAPTPIADPGKLMRAHGTVSTVPATDWKYGVLTGNGNMGAVLDGQPQHDVLIGDQCKLWLPKGSREIDFPAAAFLPEMRAILAEGSKKGYSDGQGLFLKKAAAWGRDVTRAVYTDPFHPGYFLNIDQPQAGPITDYARVENFSTGEVWVQWHSPDGDFKRKVFVSRPDNTIVTKTSGPVGKVSLSLTLEPVTNPLIASTSTFSDGWIMTHNVYVKGKGGFDTVFRILNDGGTQTSDGKSVAVTNANSVTVLSRIVAWRTPFLGTEAWENNPANSDFAGAPHLVKRDTIQVAGKDYDPKWMDEIKSDLASIPSDYDALFAPHAADSGRLYNRVSIDLGGSPEERAMTSEALLSKAYKEAKLSPALLERMYDAGRYVFMSAAGRQTPPNLFGIWTGTWSPAWSGDYTTDTNLECDTELAYSANLADCMDGYFYLWDSYVPDFRHNAETMYGCRGILVGTRASNNGLDQDWSSHFGGNMWTTGGCWIAHWYYDYYQYTGDKTFLRNEAIPFMKQCALFFEDFLKPTEDASGHYVFRPSYSPENGSGDNSAEDIEMTHELLTNLIAGCETLHIEADGVARWKEMLTKMHPLMINAQGQLKEWSDPDHPDHNAHRHLMHLYSAFESQQFSEEENPKMWAAERVALINRVTATTEQATHGYMQTGLAAASLGMGDIAFRRIELMVTGSLQTPPEKRANGPIKSSIYPNMVDAHNPGPGLLCDDGNGATPEIVDRMFIQSKIGTLFLLPAVPKTLPRGKLCGTCARGQITVNELEWDMAAGRCQATITSAVDQSVKLMMGRDLQVKSISVDGTTATVATEGVSKFGTELNLVANKPTVLAINLTPVQ